MERTIEGIIGNNSRSACLCNYFERRVTKGQKKINIRSYESRGKSTLPVQVQVPQNIRKLYY